MPEDEPALSTTVEPPPESAGSASLPDVPPPMNRRRAPLPLPCRRLSQYRLNAPPVEPAPPDVLPDDPVPAEPDVPDSPGPVVPPDEALSPPEPLLPVSLPPASLAPEPPRGGAAAALARRR
ncbi:MAG: hypothetical protein R2838_19195 [Caldilineaceae bacterium]